MRGWSSSQNVEIVSVSTILSKENMRCGIKIFGTDIGSELRCGPYWFSDGFFTLVVMTRCIQCLQKFSHAGVNQFLARKLCMPLSDTSLSFIDLYINSLNPRGPSCYYMGHLPPGQQKSAFCSHSLFICFIWFLQYTVVALCSCHRLILLLEAHCVLCDVRNGYFYIT